MSLKSYEQQPDEAPSHFAWFRSFLELGPSRTLIAAYRSFGDRKGQNRTGKQAENVSGAWRRAFDIWQWRERAAQFDLDESDARLQAQRERERALVDKIFEGVARSIEGAERAERLSELILQTRLYDATSKDGKTTLVPTRWDFNTGVRAQLVAATSRRSAAQLLEALDKLRCKRAAREMLDTLPVPDRAPTLAERREQQNAVLDRLEEVAVTEALSGVDGAAERVLRIHKRAAQLNGLDAPFDPRSVPQPPKKRRDLSSLTDEQLAQLELITESLEDGNERE